MFAPKLWGIDLGRSAVKGVLLTRVKDGVEILDADIIALKGRPPEVLKEPSRDVRLWEALGEFQKKHQLSSRLVAIAIPPQNTLVSDIRITLVGKRKLEELVRFEAANVIPFVLEEVLWDYHLFDGSQDENTREGVIFAVKKTVIQTYLHALSQVGVERVGEITLAPLAALSFLRFELGRDSSAFVLDVGAENTSMIAIDGDRFWIRSLLTGGNRVTQALSERFGIPPEQAEQAKQNISRSKLAAQLLEAIKPGLHELAGQLKTSLDYFQRIGKRTEFEKAFAVGAGSRLLGLKAQIHRSLGRELEDIRSLERVFVSSRADVPFIQKNLDRLAVAIGTGIKALGKAETRVSLVPASTARIARASRAKRSLFVAAIIVWAMFLTVFSFMKSYGTHLEAEQQAYRTVDQAWRENQRELKEQRGREQIEQELQYLYAIGQGRERVPGVLSEVVRVFNEANGSGTCHMIFQSFECKPAGREGGGGEQGEARGLVVTVTGRVYVPPDPREAYFACRDRLREPLRSSPLLARTLGKATFTDNQREVTGLGTWWKGTVRTDDDIKPDRGDVWYKVARVKSNTELVLDRPFAGDDLTGPCTISRVEINPWKRETLEFTIRAELPAKARHAPVELYETPE